MPTFGERIRTLRKARQWSYRQAANRLGISQAYLYRIEAESVPPSEDMVRVFADVFHDDYDYLLFLTGRMPSDCEAIVTADATMPAFLRWVAAKRWTGAQLYAALAFVDLPPLPQGRSAEKTPPAGE